MVARKLIVIDSGHWIPIDGTKGFLRKEQYAVSLALIVNGKIVVGVLGCPNLSCPEDESASGTIYYAVCRSGRIRPAT